MISAARGQPPQVHCFSPGSLSADQRGLLFNICACCSVLPDHGMRHSSDKAAWGVVSA